MPKEPPALTVYRQLALPDLLQRGIGLEFFRHNRQRLIISLFQPSLNRQLSPNAQEVPAIPHESSGVYQNCFETGAALQKERRY